MSSTPGVLSVDPERSDAAHGNTSARFALVSTRAVFARTGLLACLALIQYVSLPPLSMPVWWLVAFPAVLLWGDQRAVVGSVQLLIETSLVAAISTVLNYRLSSFISEIVPQYDAPCIVGVPLVRLESSIKHGLAVIEPVRLNCACLVEPGGGFRIHEKRCLVPFTEKPLVNFAASSPRRSFTPGTTNGVFQFTRQDGRPLNVAVAVCYEAFFSSLPQFQREIDCLVVIASDTTTLSSPDVFERQLIACRYRAIETQAWTFVCMSESGTSVISPNGTVVRRLPQSCRVLSFPSRGQ